MTTISKRDALKLAEEIRQANIAGHAIARRTKGDSGSVYAGFVGGLHSVIRNFVLMYAGSEAGAAIDAAMDYRPTDADIAERNARIDSYLRSPT